MKKTVLGDALSVLPIIVALAWMFGGSSANAQGWLSKASGGAIKTPDPIRKIAPNGISMQPKESNSHLQVLSPDTIRSDGSVVGGSNSGNVGKVGQAKLIYQGGLAYYSWPGATNHPLRAPKFDKAAPASASTFKTKIDPNNGSVSRVEYVNGQPQLGSVNLGTAQLVYSADGRAMYTYNGQTVVANKPPRKQPSQSSQPLNQFPQSGKPNQQQVQKPVFPQNQFPQGQGQFPQNGSNRPPQNNMNRPQNRPPQNEGVGIAIDILRALNQAQQNSQRRP